MLWDLQQRGAKIQVAEQYFRSPLIAAGLRAIEEGLLGEPDCVRLSLCHEYHGFSVARRMLGMGGGHCFPDVRITGRRYAFPVERTDSRYGPIADGSVADQEQVLATVEYGNGKVLLYDFDSVQYRSTIRSRHICVRGPRGEWNDAVLRYSDAEHRPQMRKLLAVPVPGCEDLVTPELQAIGEQWNPLSTWRTLRTSTPLRFFCRAWRSMWTADRRSIRWQRRWRTVIRRCC